jgi:hypothetical protein
VATGFSEKIMLKQKSWSLVRFKGIGTLAEIGLLQEQVSQPLVRAHELPDVILDFKAGMNDRPNERL